jgi:hypothetical protein
VTPENDADAVRKRMAELRRELTCDVRDVRTSARAMANPSFYIRKFPWATIAIAAAVGYLLVPKKKQVVQPDTEALAEMIRKHQVKLDTSQVSAESKGMLKSLAVMGLTWAARTGMNYVIQQMTTASKTPPQEEPAPVSPVEEPWNPAH